MTFKDITTTAAFEKLNETIRHKFGCRYELISAKKSVDEKGKVWCSIGLFDENLANLGTLTKIGKIVRDYIDVDEVWYHGLRVA